MLHPVDDKAKVRGEATTRSDTGETALAGVLAARLAAYAIAAAAVLLLGTGWPEDVASIAITFLGLGAVIDLLHLAVMQTRFRGAVVSNGFALAHVAVIGLMLASAGGLGESDGAGLAEIVAGPAPVLFFAAVVFAIGSAIPLQPLLVAIAGAACWLSLAGVGLMLSGAAPSAAALLLGQESDSPAIRALWTSALGSVLLVSTGVAGRLAVRLFNERAAGADIVQRRRDLLGQYLPPDAAHRLAAMDRLFDEVADYDCAVLLVDISHFQRKMETASLTESGGLIQEFHDLVSQVVFKNGGMLRQMEGDSLYAVFGLFEEDERGSVERAFLCAQTMSEAARLWRSDRIDRGKLPAEIFMGIDYGRCVVIPNLDPDRPDFSMIGAPFSAARRMERVARLVASDVAITGHAVQHLKENGAGGMTAMMDHRGPQKVDDRRGVVEVQTWSLPLSGNVNMDYVA